MADLAGVFTCGKEDQVTRPRVLRLDTFAKLRLLSRVARQLYLRHVKVDPKHNAGAIGADTLFGTAIFVRSPYPGASLLYHASLLAVHVLPLDIDTGVHRRCPVTAHRLSGRTSGTSQQSQHRERREHPCSRHMTRRKPFHEGKVSNFTPNRKTVMKHFTQGIPYFCSLLHLKNALLNNAK